MKKIYVVAILMSWMGAVKAESVLKNSLWDRASQYAGITVTTLYGIAVQESGMRWSDGSYRPWPWTLRVNKGNTQIKEGARRYSSRKEAEADLLNFLKQGIQNIDIGLMQVNYYWHKDKVNKGADLLDPATNIIVAAKYLRDLNNKKSVNHVIADYHSPNNKERGYRYLKSVRRYEKMIRNSYE